MCVSLTPKPQIGSIRQYRGQYSVAILAWHGRVTDWSHQGKDVASTWANRHQNAYRTEPIGKILDQCARYADTHFNRFGSGIGEDGFLGEHWAQMLVSARVLLNGEMGGLDGGMCDEIILALLGAEGFLDDNGEPRID